MRKKNLLMVALATVGVGSASALAMAEVTSSPGDAPSAAAPTRAYGVFRRDQTAGDMLPARAREMLSGAADREGVDLDTARAVAPAGAGYVWAIAGPTRICLAIPDPVDGFAISCQDGEQAAAGRLWVGLNGLPGQKAGDVRLAVFAPDGVAAVQSVQTDGSHVSLPVSDNVAFADVSDSDSVEMTFDGITYTTRVPGTPAGLAATGD
jgi:hypothetical protein